MFEIQHTSSVDALHDSDVNVISRKSLGPMGLGIFGTGSIVHIFPKVP